MQVCHDTGNLMRKSTMEYHFHSECELTQGQRAKKMLRVRWGLKLHIVQWHPVAGGKTELNTRPKLCSRGYLIWRIWLHYSLKMIWMELCTFWGLQVTSLNDRNAITLVCVGVVYNSFCVWEETRNRRQGVRKDTIHEHQNVKLGKRMKQTGRALAELKAQKRPLWQLCEEGSQEKPFQAAQLCPSR